MTVEGDEVVVRLSTDEALVLFDWIHRAEDENMLPRVTSDSAEVVALNALSCLLERDLVEPFEDDYRRKVLAARQRLKGEPA